ncbi:hypothetical protein LT493_03940 [Streptomyces tricolor]|nr:hypothetical protein [Streptomyces tricolor]
MTAPRPVCRSPGTTCTASPGRPDRDYRAGDRPDTGAGTPRPAGRPVGPDRHRTLQPLLRAARTRLHGPAARGALPLHLRPARGGAVRPRARLRGTGAGHRRTDRHRAERRPWPRGRSTTPTPA